MGRLPGEWEYYSATLSCSYDDVIKWKHFPRYWPFVWWIHRSPVNSPHSGQWRGALMFSLICALNKRLSKQSWGWWFETRSLSLWRHRNVSSLCNLTLTNWGRDKMAAVSQTTFSKTFSWMKMYEFRLKIHKFVPKGTIKQYSNISSDNGLAPFSRQAIIWINVG